MSDDDYTRRKSLVERSEEAIPDYFTTNDLFLLISNMSEVNKDARILSRRVSELKMATWSVS